MASAGSSPNTAAAPPIERPITPIRSAGILRRRKPKAARASWASRYPKVMRRPALSPCAWKSNRSTAKPCSCRQSCPVQHIEPVGPQAVHEQHGPGRRPPGDEPAREPAARGARDGHRLDRQVSKGGADLLGGRRGGHGSDQIERAETETQQASEKQRRCPKSTEAHAIAACNRADRGTPEKHSRGREGGDASYRPLPFGGVSPL